MFLIISCVKDRWGCQRAELWGSDIRSWNSEGIQSKLRKSKINIWLERSGRLHLSDSATGNRYTFLGFFGASKLSYSRALTNFKHSLMALHSDVSGRGIFSSNSP